MFLILFHILVCQADDQTVTYGDSDVISAPTTASTIPMYQFYPITPPPPKIPFLFQFIVPGFYGVMSAFFHASQNPFPDKDDELVKNSLQGDSADTRKAEASKSKIKPNSKKVKSNNLLESFNNLTHIRQRLIAVESELQFLEALNSQELNGIEKQNFEKRMKALKETKEELLRDYLNLEDWVDSEFIKACSNLTGEKAVRLKLKNLKTNYSLETNKGILKNFKSAWYYQNLLSLLDKKRRISRRP